LTLTAVLYSFRFLVYPLPCSSIPHITCSPPHHAAHPVIALYLVPQKQLELKALTDRNKRELTKRTNWLAMTPKKRERFRQIRMWKKQEVAELIQRWWRYLMGQKAYYEAVKKAQVFRVFCTYVHVCVADVSVHRHIHAYICMCITAGTC
jgi:hypothetical protein